MIRHSITAGNLKKRYIGKTDEPLCEEGVRLLEGKRYPRSERLYVSPMLRCIQTAEILFPGQEKIIVEEFRECDFGEFENKNYLELSGNLHYQQWIDSGGTLPFPGGESREGFQQRCVQAFEKIVSESVLGQIENVAIVAHGGTIMSIMEKYGTPERDYFSWALGNGEAYILELPDIVKYE